MDMQCEHAYFDIPLNRGDRCFGPQYAQAPKYWNVLAQRSAEWYAAATTLHILDSMGAVERWRSMMWRNALRTVSRNLMSGEPSGKNKRGVLSTGIASSKSKSEEAEEIEEMVDTSDRPDMGRGGSRFNLRPFLPFFVRLLDNCKDGNRRSELSRSDPSSPSK